jgi:hypothetical protein
MLRPGKDFLMARPLFEIAREIVADWQNPSPQAKTYLKGLLYLLGMDDRVADLDASTAVRMFLLYAKQWTGPVAERVKAELQGMRSSHGPNNAYFLKSHTFAVSQEKVAGCDLCDAALGEPGKFVDGYTHWNKRARMCMHCNCFLSSGLEFGNGRLYIAAGDGTWLALHGEPKPVEISTAPVRPRVSSAMPKPTLRFRMKYYGKKVYKKLSELYHRVARRSA